MKEQRKIIQICADVGRFVVNFLSTIIMFVLFVYAMRSSFSRWYDELGGYTELIIPRIKDNIIWNIIVLSLMLVSIFAFLHFRNKFLRKERNCLIIRWSMTVITLILSGMLVVNLDVTPTSDSADLINYVRTVLEGDWSPFGLGGYMSRYPQQIGMFSVLYLLMKWTRGGGGITRSSIVWHYLAL